MNIITILMIITIMMGCIVWLIIKAAKAVSDPNNSFSEVEFAVSAIAMLFCGILISYFALASVTQSSTTTQLSYQETHHNGANYISHESSPKRWRF